MQNIIKNFVKVISVLLLTAVSSSAGALLNAPPPMPVPASASAQGQGRMVSGTNPISNANPNLTTGLHTVYHFDVNSTSLTPIHENNIMRTQGQYGRYHAINAVTGKDINATNPQSMIGYVNKLKAQTPSTTYSIISQFKTDLNGTGKFNYHNITSLSNAALSKEYDANSTIVKGITTIHNFQVKARSLVANLKTIQCYVTRKLTNSFYCPLPNKNQSYFIGGSYADDSQSDLKQCNSLCTAPSKCLYKDMDKNVTTVVASDLNITGGQTINFKTDNDMEVKDLTLNFNAKYQYDKNISITSKDYNATIADNDLNASKNHFLNINLSYLDPTTNTYKIAFAHYKINFFHTMATANLYFSGLPSHTFRITFFKPYTQHGKLQIVNNKRDYNTTITSSNNLHVTLQNATINYVGNKWWFCPATQFGRTQQTCPGTLKEVAIGSEVYSVCVTQAGQQREPKYGAYYTQQSCNSQCYTSAQCVPTYRQISSSNLSNILQNGSYADVAVGCVNSPSNTSCTQQLCMKLFEADTMPITEKTWTANAGVEYTVRNGAPVPGTTRPRFDIQQAISANGNQAERQIANLKEMVEVAYNNMIKNGNYDVSAYDIGDDIPKKLAYGNESLDGTSDAIFAKVRPNSFAINNGKKYNIYLLFKINSIFHPIYGVYTGPNNETVTGQIDPKWLIMDQADVLKTPTGYQVFSRTNNKSFYICDENNTIAGQPIDYNTCPHTWINVPNQVQVNNDMYKTTGPVAYDLNSIAPASYVSSFSNSHIYTPFTAFNSLQSISSTTGVLFDNQQSGGAGIQRIYEGGLTQNGSHFYQLQGYLVYSLTPLSYQQLLQDMIPSNQFYSTNHLMPTKIQDDSATPNPNIQMYIGGQPNNISILNQFTPTIPQENKRAFIFMLLYDQNMTQ